MEKAAFSVLSSDILILVQHLTPTSPHQEAKHSISLAWGWSAWIQSSISQVSLPDHSTAPSKPRFTISCFPGWKKCLPACHKSQSTGVFRVWFQVLKKQLLLLSLPSSPGWQQRKQPEKHTEDAVWEPATPEDSCCLKKSASFTSFSAGWVEQDWSQQGITRTGCWMLWTTGVWQSRWERATGGTN